MWKRLALFCSCAAVVLGQPPKQPPKSERDLRIEKIEKDGGEPAAPTINIPRSYAVVIGVSKYRNLGAESQLAYAEADAQMIFKVLISQQGGAFPAANVHMLTNEKATLANIRQEINNWLPSQAKDDDRVLIYFAGHGFLDRKTGKGYLAPYDIQRDNLAGSGFPMEELGQTVGGKIHAKSKILLTDACHSGAITPEDTADLNQKLVRLNTSLFSLTASRDREASNEGPGFGGGHGVFTYYVVKGLEGLADDTPRDGKVTADELAEYVRTNVREQTQGQQNPTSDKSSFDPNMFLAYVPANAPIGVPRAPTRGTLVFESNMDDVTLFVDGNSQGVLSKGVPFRLPGLTPGTHIVQGVHNGYEPDGPREEPVYPGEERTVTIRIAIPRRRKQAAVDLLDKGMKDYLKGDAGNYKKALESFTKAFAMDDKYSQAAYYMARAYNALFDEANADKYFRKAIEIDPDYMEARTNYAGMLLDRMDSQEAIRHLTVVLQREPQNVVALTHSAQAYRMQDAYPAAIEKAQQAIKLAPTVGEAYLWLGDSLRLSGKEAEAEVQYETCLKLMNFDPTTMGQLNYYILGSLFGVGRRHRAAEHDIWRDMRSLTYFGLCDSERRLQKYDVAVAFCQKALSYAKDDPYAHYAMGLSLAHQGSTNHSPAELNAAISHLKQVIAINPDMQEAALAARNITAIEKFMAVEAQTRRAN